MALKYRHLVEAVMFDGSEASVDAIRAMVDGNENCVCRVEFNSVDGILYLHDFDFSMIADVGDYIILSTLDDTCVPIKGDVFRDNFELIKEQ